LRAVAVALYVAVDAVLLVWAVWLLATDDPDGGRHPAGGAMLGAAVVLGVAGLVSARRTRLRRAAGRL
jgi:hypothetical protein